MLEIGADNSNPGDLIKDVNEDTFMTDVVEASQEVPVIVDFGLRGVVRVKHWDQCLKRLYWLPKALLEW